MTEGGLLVAVWLLLGAAITGVWVGRTPEKVDGGSAVLMCLAYPLVLTVLLVAAATRAVTKGRSWERWKERR